MLYLHGSAFLHYLYAIMRRMICNMIMTAAMMTLMPADAAVAEDIVPDNVKALSDSIKAIFAPDGRTVVYAPDFAVAGRDVLLRGETSSEAAKKALVTALERKQYNVIDHMRLLPDCGQLDDETYGVVNLSVCNLRTKPDFSAEMTSQALMGMPVRVLERGGTWFRVQTPDNYIAWVHPAGIRRMTKAECDSWNSSRQIVVTAHFGYVYSEPKETSQVVSDIVAGDRLKLIGQRGRYYNVEYPDGRRGYVLKGISRQLDKWRQETKQDAASIISTARSMMGFPYLWAGTSSKGVDCSGFMRTILYMHDIIIPRDASQMAYVGQRVDIAPDFSNLEPGDLVFFGTKAQEGKRERVSHVGMYIGGKRFIHSQGDVHVSSFDPADELYDEFNLNRLLHAVRFLHLVGKDSNFTTTEDNPYFHNDN